MGSSSGDSKGSSRKSPNRSRMHASRSSISSSPSSRTSSARVRPSTLRSGGGSLFRSRFVVLPIVPHAERGQAADDELRRQLLLGVGDVPELLRSQQPHQRRDVIESLTLE